MKVLNKKFWVLHQDGAILNKDYKEEQSGECNVGAGIKAAEFDTLAEMTIFVEENGLTLKNEENNFTAIPNNV